MNNTRIVSVLVLSLLLLAVPCSLFPVPSQMTQTAWAATPNKYISFQGQLSDSTNARVSGSVSVTFKLYDVSAGGAALWTEAQSLSADNGITSAVLGSVTELGLAFDTQYWLGITVGADAEMSPRIRMTSTPYAFTAFNLADSAHARGSLKVTDTFVVGDTFLVVTKSGKVGIGTDSPTTALNVVSTSGPVVEFDAYGAAPIVKMRHANGTPSAPTAMLLNDNLGTFSMSGYGTTGFGNPGKASLKGIAAENWSDAAQGAHITLATTPIGSTTSDERVRITDAGNVGIGTTSPSDSLTVNGSFSSDTMAIGDTRLVVTGTGDVGINKVPTTNVNLEVYSSGDAQFWLRSPNSGLKFQNWNGMNFIESAGSNMTGSASLLFTGMDGAPEFMRITTAGNVGIGTTTPGDSLHVAGRIQMDTNATASAADGAIRWSGADFQGRKAGSWVSMTGTGAGGDITDVTAGAGLTGGGASGGVTVSVDTTYAHTWAALQTFDSAAKFSDSVVVSDTVLVVNKQSGNVGIGTASPATTLDVRGTILFTDGSSNGVNRISGSRVQFGSSTSTPVDLFVGGSVTALSVATSGNVGIGSTSPGTMLDVSGGAHVSDSFAVGGAAGDSLVVLRSGNVGIGTATPTDSLTVAGNISVDSPTLYVDAVNNYVGIGTTGPQDALHVSGTVRATSLRSAMVVNAGDLTHAADAGNHIFTNNTVERMRLTSAGNLGIGTATPTDSLHVVGPARFTDSVVVSDTVLVVNKQTGNVGIGTANPSYSLTVGPDQTVSGLMPRVVVNTKDGVVERQFLVGSGDSGVIIGYGMGNTIQARTGPTFNNNGDLIMNYWGGNVGIGQSVNPQAKLDVSGGAHVSDSFTVGGATGDSFVVLRNGNVGIGTASPDTTLSVNGGASKVGGGSWATFSDSRLKTVEGDFKAGTAEVMKLNPVRYRYNKDNPAGIKDGAEHIGLVAQEAQAAIPEAVSTNNKGYLMLNNDPIIFAMLNAIKEQQKEIESLKSKIDALENQSR